MQAFSPFTDKNRSILHQSPSIHAPSFPLLPPAPAIITLRSPLNAKFTRKRRIITSERESLFTYMILPKKETVLRAKQKWQKVRNIYYQAKFISKKKNKQKSGMATLNTNIILEIAHTPAFATTIKYMGPMLGIIILLGILYHSFKRIQEGYYQAPPFIKKKKTPEILISGMAGGLSILGMVIMLSILFNG